MAVQDGKRRQRRPRSRFRFRLGTLLAVQAVCALVIAVLVVWKVTLVLIVDAGLLAVIGMFAFELRGYLAEMRTREILDGLQLAAMQQRPLGEALERMEQQAPWDLCAVLADLRAVWAETGSLADGLDLYPRKFGGDLRRAVRTAERHGILEQVLPHLRQESLARSTAGRILLVSVSYPVLLAAFVIGVQVSVQPRLLDLASYYSRWAVVLPVTSHAANLGVGCFLGVVAACMLLALAGWLDTRSRLVGVAARIPLVGELVYGAAAARYANVVSALLAGGLPWHEAHRTAAEAQPGEHLQRRFGAVTALLADGVAPARALERIAVPDRYRIPLVHAALSSAPGPAFARAARLIAEGVERLRLRMVRGVYPVAIVWFGLIVGGMLFSLFDLILRIRASL